MTGQEVRSLSRRHGHTIGCHGVHHLCLPGQPWIVQREEVRESKLSLESLLGRELMSFAYPYGACDEQTKVAVRSAGIDLAVTTQPGLVFPGANPLTLPRNEVHPWTVDDFARWLRDLFQGGRRGPASCRESADSHRPAAAPRRVITKAPRDVVHEPEALEGYLDLFLRQEHLTFEEWVGRFGEGVYRARNEILLAMLKPLRPRRVLEFACAGAFLARMLLDNVDTIEEYTCSNFSHRMVEYCRRQLGGYPTCKVKLIDADVRRAVHIDAEGPSRYDTFVTTSLEHIQFDRELIAKIPEGAYFLFSVATFDDPEHFRMFVDAGQIRSRYEDLLTILDVRPHQASNKILAVCERRRPLGEVCRARVGSDVG